MVSRLIQSLSGIWAPDAEEKESNSTVDLDHELASDSDGDINDGESANGAKRPKEDSNEVAQDSLVDTKDKIKGSGETENELSLDNSEGDIAAETEKGPTPPTKPVTSSTAVSGAAGGRISEVNLFKNDRSRSGSPSKDISDWKERQRSRSRSPYKGISDRKERTRSRSRSPSNYMARVPCELTTSAPLFPGTSPSYRSTHTRINFETDFINDSVGMQEGQDQRTVTASEKLVYDMSEMQPNFIPRPATSPQEFRKLSMMTARSRSPQQRRSRSPSRSYHNQEVTSDSSKIPPSSEGHTYPLPSYAYHAPTPIPTINLRKDEYLTLPDINESQSSSILEHLNQNVNEIIAEEDAEFREKYSQWIAQLFHSQLSKMKKRLGEQFNSKLEEIISEKDREILLLNQRYEDEAKKFNQASEKLKKWVDSLEDENRRLVESKNMEVNRMETELENVQKKFENALIKQRIALMSDAEKDRQKLIDDHNSSLTKLMESSKTYDETESSAKKKVESLQRLTTTLKSKNESLRRQLKELDDKKEKEGPSRTVSSASAMNRREKDYQAEIMSLLNTVEDLRKRLSETERERRALMEFHSDEIDMLKKAAEKAEIDAAKRLHKTQETLRSVKDKYERDIKDLKMEMLNQETKYNKTFLDLKHKYGNKIESLTQVIDRIQNDFS